MIVHHNLPPDAAFNGGGLPAIGGPGEGPNPDLGIHTIHRFDKSVWRRYDFPSGTFLLTSQGRDLVGEGGVGKLLRAYAQEAAAIPLEDGDVRKYLAEGASARVFTVGDQELVIKERRPKGEEIEPALKRMDELVDLVERKCPSWIRVPEHYGVYTDRKTGREYLMMEKIDGGVSVGDILDYGDGRINRRTHLQAEVAKTFGDVTPEFKKEVRAQFDEMVGLLNDALLAESLDSDELLPDLAGRGSIPENLDNVLVRPVTTPVAGKRLQFMLIDQ